MRLSKTLGQVVMLLAAVLMVGVSVVKVRAEGEIEMEIKDEVVVDESQEVLGIEDQMVIKEEVNYYLPYPGMLPDHPLYFLKMMRDRVREWSLFDKARKAEYLALLADKRLGAGTVLVDGGKKEMGVDTYWKASRYMQRSVALIEELKQNGTEMGELANKLETATLKYDEVLERSAAKNEDLRGQIEEIRKEVMDSRNRVLRVLGR